MDAITEVPTPANEPVHDYAPGSPERTRLVAALEEVADEPIDLPHVIGGSHRMGGGERMDVVQPHRHSAVLGTCTNAEHSDATAAIDAAMAAKEGMGQHPVRRTRGGVPARRRSAGRPVAGKALRRNHARPVEVGLSGRDRRGLRADRLLAVQRRFRPADFGTAADQHPRRVEPRRLSAARGVRLRRHPVQLHRDCGQSADCARADG